MDTSQLKGENKDDGEEYLQTVADMMETDKGNGTANDQSYRCAVETALSRVTTNKREMCLTKRKQFRAEYALPSQIQQGDCYATGAGGERGAKRYGGGNNRLDKMKPLYTC